MRRRFLILPGLAIIVAVAATVAALSVGTQVFAQSSTDYDSDNDGLIEIGNLAQLNAMRWDMDGDGSVSSGNQANYDAAFPNAVSGMGCPSSGCDGYELTADLDFDTNNNGQADSGDTYWNNGKGWDSPSTLSTTFHGNGHTISNLFIDDYNNDQGRDNLGLFGRSDSSAVIKNIGLIDVDIHGDDWVGALVGTKERGKIERSYATGTLRGDVGVGGLVGQSQSSTSGGGGIEQSYFIGSVNAIHFIAERAAGLVGSHGSRETIKQSYAIGRARATNYGRSGGLVGESRYDGTPIDESYAAVIVSAQRQSGGLLGYHHQTTANCPDSYWDTEVSGKSESACGAGKTTGQMKAPTSATGIYANWDAAVWDFGSDQQYPALVVDFNGDGTATWQEFGDQRPDNNADNDSLIDVSSLQQLNAMRWDLDGNGSPSSNGASYRNAFPPGSYPCPTGCNGYELTADLDFDTNGDGVIDSNDDYWNGGYGWYAIADYAATFDGNGHTIHNLFIDNSTATYVALFSLLAGDGTIRDLGLVNVNVTGMTSVGALVGRLFGHVERSFSTGTVNGTNDSVGGLVGEVWDDASVKHSYSHADVAGRHFVGGLAGQSYSDVEDSYATGTVSSTNAGGGLIGDNFDGAITENYARGEILGTSASNGGLVGLNSGGSCSRNYWDTDTSGKTNSDCGTGKTTSEMAVAKTATNLYSNWDSDVWDFALLQYPALKTDWDGDGTATWQEFGVQDPVLVEYDSDGDGLLEVSNLAQLNAMRWDLDGDGSVAAADQPNYEAAFPNPAPGLGCPSAGCSGYELVADLDFDTSGDGDITSADDYWNSGSGWAPIANYAATFDGNAHTISNLFIDRDSADDVGLFGSLTSAATARDIGLADVDVTGNAAVGGLAGKNAGAIQRIYVSGEVEGDDDVGGLVGQNSSGATTRQSYSTASVTGSADQVGGLAGLNQGTVERGYATGAVTGDDQVGGLVGENAATGAVRQSYSTGDVTGVTDNGGLVGKNDSGTCENSYWDTETSGLATSGCGTGKTTAELAAAKSSANLYAQWDDTGWATGDGQYPALKADWDGDGTATWREFGEQLPFLQDGDGDGLVDISDVHQLNAVRWDLDGDGTPSAGNEDAYRAGFRHTPSGSKCPSAGCTGHELVANLDFDTNGDDTADSGDAFWNEGSGWDPIDAYAATLDGDGHTIANLFINRVNVDNNDDTGDRIALLGSLTSAGSVSDLGLDDVDVTGSHWVAGVVGYNEGTIERSYVTGEIASANLSGALAGENRPGSVIKVSYATATINGAWRAGGVAGRNMGTIEDSYAAGPVNGYSDFGGVVGHNNHLFDRTNGENVARRTFATGLLTGGTPTYGGVAMVAVLPDSTCPDSVWDTEATGATYSACGTGQTTAQMQNPTSATGIYANYSASVWDFGNATQYPALKADWDGDGTATWEEFGDQRSGTDYDVDNDGLIEIANLAQLNAMRWDPDGDGVSSAGSYNPVLVNPAGYEAAFDTPVVGMGCPSSGCVGYELTGDMDFDTDGDGAADSDDAYWNNGEGWEPFFFFFNATFDGNGHTLSNLFINRPNEGSVGLFGLSDAAIKDVNLTGVNVTGATGAGSLVGYNMGTIDGSSAAGVVAGNSIPGGLVGANHGTITGSSAAVAVSTNHNSAGGLVGQNQSSGSIVASYATGDVTGGSGGGLVGMNFASVSSSYATGNVAGDGRSGGLVGNHFGTVEDSYATGSVTTTSYSAGGLVGLDAGTCTDSYWDTTTSGITTTGCGDGKTTTELQTPTTATGIYVNWDDTVWDFGTATDYPTLP